MRVPAICPLLSCWPVPSGALLISLACTRACTLRRRIAIPALACSSALHSYWHARAGAAAAVQLLRSHTPQPAHGALAMVVLFRARTDLACTHARSADAMQFLRSHAPQTYAAICLLAHARMCRRRTTVAYAPMFLSAPLPLAHCHAHRICVLQGVR